MNEISATTDPSPDDDDFSESIDDGHTLPADSPITIDRFPDGVTIQIPPTGLWRGNLLFPLALIWNGCMLLWAAPPPASPTYPGKSFQVVSAVAMLPVVN